MLVDNYQVQSFVIFLGYNAYLGMIYTEHTHNNPVLRVFCQLLLEQKKAPAKTDGETLKNLMDEETGGAELEMKVKEFISMEEGSVKSSSEEEVEFKGMKERNVLRQLEETVMIETEPDKSGSCLPKEFTEVEDGRAEQTELVETNKTLAMDEIEKMEEDVVVGTGETDKFVQTQENAAQDKGQERFSKSLQENKNTGIDDEICLPEITDESNQPVAPKRSYCFYSCFRS